ncbi:hypothetical protein [Chryseobacterium takakiae]|uniref:hypothetical protein n=1 Tax=Chryseobacterium takakiae TaxID=1302685 RepID=UPI001160338C|nr:hypothetical protein [Chryseobacterium takakiae]
MRNISLSRSAYYHRVLLIFDRADFFMSNTIALIAALSELIFVIGRRGSAAPPDNKNSECGEQEKAPNT